MKKQFDNISIQNRRLIVIHDTFEYSSDEILNVLKCNDVLFLDDCLYSLYVFLASNAVELLKRNIICIIGFSANIYRYESSDPIFEANCAIYHDRIHSGDINARNAYMTISEIKLLLEYDNIYLAGHGYNHLNFLSMQLSNILKSKFFSNDIKLMIEKYNKFGFNTNIFVFPYTNDDILLAYKILKKYNFLYFFASKLKKRLKFESLISGNLEEE